MPIVSKPHSQNFLLARYSADGIPEAHGQTGFTSGRHSGAADVIIQPDGKILVIGCTRNPNPAINGKVFVIARFTGITGRVSIKRSR